MNIKVYFPICIILAFLSCEKNKIDNTVACEGYANDSSALHPRAFEFQKLLDEYVAQGIPGISMLIHDENGVWMGAAGKADIANNVDMQPCVVSKSCSITKTILATVIMKLMEEGKMSVDDMASKWLDEDIVTKVSNLEDCTIRNLMNHTSGIYNLSSDSGFYLQLLNNPTHYWSYDDLLKYVYGKDAYFAVNADVKYSNTNYLLLAMIVDEVAGVHHSELMHEMVIDKLGMENTYYHYHDQLPEFTAQGYYDLYNNGTILNITNYNTGSGNGYGGLYSTSYDIHKLCNALLVDKTLLKQETLELMMSFGDIEEEKDRRLGLGLFYDFTERPADEYGIGHRGRDFQYTADMFYFPNAQTTMVYHVNYGTDGDTPIGDVFFDFRTAVVDKIFNR